MAETPLPHLNERGDARMVDVSTKAVSARSATAAGLVRLSPEAVAALRSDSLPKGDALAVARIAGIQAAKRPRPGHALPPAGHQRGGRRVLGDR